MTRDVAERIYDELDREDQEQELGARRPPSLSPSRSEGWRQPCRLRVYHPPSTGKQECTQQDREDFVQSLISNQALSGIVVTRLQAEKAVDKALAAPRLADFG